MSKKKASLTEALNAVMFDLEQGFTVGDLIDHIQMFDREAELFVETDKGKQPIIGVSVMGAFVELILDEDAS